MGRPGEIWFHRQPIRDVLLLCPHSSEHSVKQIVLVRVMPAALTDKFQISVA